jgi:NadR type nicotinamide-nucleotide adenylyltransferase
LTGTICLKKIVTIGPESTGKSVLCEQLAAHYKTVWCPEYAREYLLKYGMSYTYDDLLTIAMGQNELEDRIVNRESAIVNRPIHDSRFTIADSPVFIDTNMYVMKVWCEFVYGNCHRYILDQIVERKYDLYLLCNIDLPWVKDDLREYPDLESRQTLYSIYKDILINQDVPWIEVTGNYEERFNVAVKAVDKLISSSS